MLARQFTLKGEEEFERVRTQGRLFQSDSFGMSVLERGDSLSSRFAFIVSSKVSKEAVQRNRIKRALSEAVRFEMTRLKKGFNAIFLAKQISTTKSTDELMREVREALESAGLRE
ncbi:ribonuclease P protein component [Candidatus Woesebacteria bacterium]|nr:ribonuclease P protein component [Candidatus Woesebacteria bacterium]